MPLTGRKKFIADEIVLQYNDLRFVDDAEISWSVAPGAAAADPSTLPVGSIHVNTTAGTLEIISDLPEWVSILDENSALTWLSTKDASILPIANAGGYFIGADVETALDELGEFREAQTDTGFAAWSDEVAPFWTQVGGTIRLDKAGHGFIKGQKVTWTAPQQTGVLSANTLYRLYIDGNGVLQTVTTASQALYENNIVLFEVLYDGTNYFVVKENHGVSFDTSASAYIHRNVGSVISGSGAVIDVVTLGNGALPAHRQIEIIGADVYEDHGLLTTIPDSGGAGITLDVFYTNASGKWVRYTQSTQLPAYYNNAGTPTALANTERVVFRIYVSKDNLNTTTPWYIAVMDNAKYASLAAARAGIIAGAVDEPTNELDNMEPAQLGYAICVKNAPGFAVEEIVVSQDRLRSVASSGGATSASVITTNTTNFDGILSSGDTTVQTALETLDDHNHDSRYYTESELGATGASAGSKLIGTDVTGFGGVLSAADNTVQKALDTLDNMVAGMTSFDFSGSETPGTGDNTISSGETFSVYGQNGVFTKVSDTDNRLEIEFAPTQAFFDALSWGSGVASGIEWTFNIDASGGGSDVVLMFKPREILFSHPLTFVGIDIDALVPAAQIDDAGTLAGGLDKRCWWYSNGQGLIPISDFTVLEKRAAPPGVPAVGDTYIVEATASGAWAGKEEDVATYNGTAWDFWSADYGVNMEGLMLWVNDENLFYVFNGSAWQQLGASGVGLATTSATGVSELATSTEINTGTDTGRTVCPDALAASYAGTKSVCIVPFASDETVVIGNGTIGFCVPDCVAGMDLVNVRASVYTLATGSPTGTTDIQIRRSRAGSDVDMLTTKITMATSEYTASDEGINTSNDDVSAGDMIFVDVDAVVDGTADPLGLSVSLEFRLP